MGDTILKFVLPCFECCTEMFFVGTKKCEISLALLSDSSGAGCMQGCSVFCWYPVRKLD